MSQEHAKCILDVTRYLLFICTASLSMQADREEGEEMELYKSRGIQIRQSSEWMLIEETENQETAPETETEKSGE